ncbi:unnamed protein product [Thelazia callipaeda]|uniref:heparosan-N-sulfate-glucuronate 5-epimerase n=1 Tax=Thelazia callipaeda TaxID=103827 RepID=A0A0N5D0U5_THECL|nr:unnamed protein product [Thelazia callipaeda]
MVEIEFFVNSAISHHFQDNAIENGKPSLEKVSCTVDNKKTYQCYLDKFADEVYFPFNSFLKKHLDVSGKFTKASKLDVKHFEWSTSHARIRFPNFTHYDFRGAFGHFASYSVETRDRVRCISAQFGVPLSTQWSSVPYFYPIQIAQYALQHYSRFQAAPVSTFYLKGTTSKEWNDNTLNNRGVQINFDLDTNSTRIELNAADRGISLALDRDPSLSVLSFFWMADADGSFTVKVKLVHTAETLFLNYVHSDDEQCVWQNVEKSKSDYSYSLGIQSNPDEWRWICRDLLADAGRALALTAKKKESVLLRTGDVSVDSVMFWKHSVIRDLKQRSSAHLEYFFIAADWFTDNQDKHGGWPVPVERSIADKRLILPAGWYSAMAQGHALSVLTRAFVLTNDTKYLQAAKNALLLFKTAKINDILYATSMGIKLSNIFAHRDEAAKGGVRNELFHHPWFEEYPTTPGTFVLNGFLYSLIGLYDFAQLSALRGDENDSAALFSIGLESLRTFLPLFDTGSGTLYDLRHLNLRGAPNLARWDYHSVHIYLLKWLYIITKDELFNVTADRWAAYATGHRAKHN